MKTYKMNIAGCERALPLCPLNDKISIAAFVMFGDVELTEACAKALLERAPEYDYLLTAEAKGIPLCYEMARQSKAETYIVARKKSKFYMTGVLDVEVNSITTSGTQHLYLDQLDVDVIRGKRVLIVDDVISTGESLHALEALADQAGAVIAGRMAVLAEGESAKRPDLVYLNPLPLFDPEGNPIWD